MKAIELSSHLLSLSPQTLDDLEAQWVESAGRVGGGEGGGTVALRELYDRPCSCLSCQSPRLCYNTRYWTLSIPLDTLHTTGKSDVSPPRPFHQAAMLPQLELQCMSDL